MSLIAIGGGLVCLLLACLPPACRASGTPLPRPEAKRIFDALDRAGLVRLSRAVTEAMHNGALQPRPRDLRRDLPWRSARWAFRAAACTPRTRATLPVDRRPSPWAGCSMIAGAVGVVLLHRHRFLSLVLTGIVGLLISPLFVYFSAPDLALTQISVEMVTILLMLLALHFLPKETPRRKQRLLRRLRDGGIAGGGGPRHRRPSPTGS